MNIEKGQEAQVDVTNHAIDLANIVDKISKKRNGVPYPSSLHIIEVYTGSVAKKITNFGDDKIEEYGKGSEFKGTNESTLHTIITKMSNEGIIIEKKKKTPHGIVSYWETGSNFSDFVRSGQPKILIDQIQNS